MNHDELEGLSKDDHRQYIYANPTTDTRNQILPARADVVGLTFRGALGHKASFVKFNSFRGDTLTEIKADGTLEAPNIQADTAHFETLHIKQVESTLIDTDVLQANSISSSKINGININELQGSLGGHAGNGDIHYKQDQIDHQVIKGSGHNTHQDIDKHLGRRDIHFTISDICHGDIQGVGTKTHAEIDGHLADKVNHYPVESINHSVIQGLGNDDHDQYLHIDGRRNIKKLQVDETLNVGGRVDVNNHVNIASGLVCNSISAPDANLGLLHAHSAKLTSELITNIIRNQQFVGDHIRCTNQDIHGDLRVAGTVNGIKLQDFVDTFYKHIRNEGKELIHPVFTSTKKGFVPTPAGIVSENRYLVASGRWKSFGEYLELLCSGNEFLLDEVIESEDFRWVYDSSSVVVPLAGVYEFNMINVDEAHLNGELIPKSKLQKFLLKLNRKDKITFVLPKYLGSVYIKRIDDTGEL